MATSTFQIPYYEFLGAGSESLYRVTAAADTATFSSAGGSGVSLKGIASPVDNQDAANKAYVDNLSQGLSWKAPVRVLSDTNGTLATAYAAGQSVDSVVLALNDRILLNAQSTGSENGIWVVTAGAPTRPSDYASASIQSGVAVFINEGTNYADQGYVLSTENVTVDTTAHTFVQFSSQGTITAGDGLDKIGTTLSVNVDDVGIEIVADTLQLKDAGVTNAKLANDSLTVTAGSGLINGGPVALGAATTLDVNVDDVGIEIVADALQLKDGGVTNAKLANDSVTITAGNGLTGGGAVTLGSSINVDVNVDDVGIEIVADTLQIKSGGISNSDLANDDLTITAGDGLQNGGLVALGGSVTLDVDATVVRTTGNQSIAGVKTFTDTTQATSPTAAGTLVQGGLGVALDLRAAGNIYGLSFTASSDRRLKQNIREVEDSKKIYDVKPVYYEWTHVNDQRTHCGVIAQDLQPIVPDAVTESEILQVDYTHLFCMMLKELQNCHNEIQELKASSFRSI